MKMADSRTCGSCSLCCKLYAVAELIKPRDTWCRHVVLGKGCGLHPNWPKVCDDFLCLWRDDRLAPMLPDKARPDRCGVVLTAAGGGKAVVAVCRPDKPMAWRDSPEVHRFLTMMAATGASVSVRSGNVYFIVGSRGFMEVPREWIANASADQEFTVRVPDNIRVQLGIGPDVQPRPAKQAMMTAPLHRERISG